MIKKTLLTITLTLGTLMASSLPTYETKTLKNGLQIVVIPLENSTESLVLTSSIKLEAEMKSWEKLELLTC